MYFVNIYLKDLHLEENKYKNKVFFYNFIQLSLEDNRKGKNCLKKHSSGFPDCNGFRPQKFYIQILYGLFILTKF